MVGPLLVPGFEPAVVHRRGSLSSISTSCQSKKEKRKKSKVVGLTKNFMQIACKLLPDYLVANLSIKTFLSFISLIEDESLILISEIEDYFFDVSLTKIILLVRASLRPCFQKVEVAATIKLSSQSI